MARAVVDLYHGPGTGERAEAAFLAVHRDRELPQDVREVPVEVRVSGPFELDEAKVRELQITPRELEILGLIADGLSNKEIAERVFVSENTVKNHVRAILEKLPAKSRIDAVVKGVHQGLVQLP